MVEKGKTRVFYEPNQRIRLHVWIHGFAQKKDGRKREKQTRAHVHQLAQRQTILQ